MPRRNPLNFDSQDLHDNLKESAGQGVDAFFGSPLKIEGGEEHIAKIVYSGSPIPNEAPPASPAQLANTPSDIEKPNERTLERSGDRPIARSTERSVPAQKRSTKRHSFEFYEDQFMRLKKIALENELRGESLSMSEIVRDALDAYFESIEKSERPVDRPVERTVGRSDERPEKSAA